jgi:hypothetical protein
MLTKASYAMINGAPLNLLDYGAVGDGVTNDTAAIQAWVNDLCDNNLEGYAPAGKYLFSSTIVLDGKCSIIGAGYSENSGNGSATEFLKASTFNGNGFTITAPAVYLANFAIEGQTGNGGDGISIENNTSTLENISVHNQGNDGVRYGTDTVGVNVNKFQARNLICHSNHRHGVFLSAPDAFGSSNCNAGLINGLNVQTNLGEGLSIGYAAANTITGIVAELNSSYGVGLHTGASQNAFFGGDINENNDAGVYDLQVDAGAEQNAFYWVAMNPTKINVLDPETMIMTEDNPAAKNSYVTFNSVATGTTQIPFDNSVPTSSEGTEFMTLTAERGWAKCGYLITVIAVVSPAADATVTMALFQDTGVSAIAATAQKILAGNVAILQLQHKVVTAPVATTTYKVRIGGDAATTYTFNGVGGTRIFGGVCSSSIAIQQINS